MVDEEDGGADAIADVAVDPVANDASVREWCQQEREWKCRHFAQCTENSWRSMFRTLEECVWLAENYGRCDLQIAYERGVAIDAHSVEACFEAATVQCDDSGARADELTACIAGSVQALGEEGEPCFTDLECAGGKCLGTPRLDGPCLGAIGWCGAPRVEGEPCVGYLDCAEPAICDRDECVVPVDDPNRCETNADCPEDLPFCDEEVGECVLYQQVGERCGFGFPHCDFEHAYCADTGWCEPHKSQGESCDGLSECGSGACFRGVCALRGDVGDECEDHTCDGGLSCVDGVCRVPGLQFGERCELHQSGEEMSDECARYLYCTRGRCAPLPAAGEACPEMRCVYYSACVDGVCVADWERDQCR